MEPDIELQNSVRWDKLRASIDSYRASCTDENDELTSHLGTSAEEDGDAMTNQNHNSMLRSICVHINEEKLTEYDGKEEDWTRLLSELKNELERDIKSDTNTVKDDITRRYGDDERNALMSILVCHPPLKLVRFIVEIGGANTVKDVSGCHFNAIHYACWGNASLDVIKYLLDIGGKDALLVKSKIGGGNPLHYACIRYRSTESNSLCDVFKLLIKVGGHDVVQATDKNKELPLQGLLLQVKPPVDSIVTYLDEWYALKEPGGELTPKIESISSHTPDGMEKFSEDQTNVELLINDPRDAVNTMFRQLSKSNSNAQGQSLKSEFMKEILTERFIQKVPLAILMMDLYIQVLIVCVFYFFINPNPNSPDLANSATIKIILGICIGWRSFREIVQFIDTPFGVYLNDISNWLDITQIVLIILTLRTNLNCYASTSSSHGVLIAATFISWFELLFEFHNFEYNLSLFVVAILKIMKRLWSHLVIIFFLIVMFANAYYIAGPIDTELCNDETEYQSEEAFNLAGGFSCTRIKSFKYSFANLLDFEIPSGVPRGISYFYGSLMVILILSIIIAKFFAEFDDVLNESELAFWSQRLAIVNELEDWLAIVNELEDLCSSPYRINSTLQMSFLRRICREVEGWCKPLQPLFQSNKRIDLNLFLKNSVWDGMRYEQHETILYWWYGKSERKVTLGERLKFFITRSTFKDIFFPTNVFRNMILGRNRSYRSKYYEKLLVLPFMIILTVGSIALFVIVLILGLLSLGVLWPKIMRKYLFSVEKKRQGIITRTIRKENNEIKNENKEMRKENNEMRKENNEMREDIKKILFGINSIDRLYNTETELSRSRIRPFNMVLRRNSSDDRMFDSASV